MQPGLLLPSNTSSDVVDLAVEAEEGGCGSVWVPELWGPSAPITAATVAARTDTVTIGTAILNVFSRTPATLAMTTHALAERTDGRFILGLGTSTKRAIEGIHDCSFERPVRRAHETVELVRCLTAGDEPVRYDGELLEIDGVPPLGSTVPIYGAALGSANRRMVGRLCDGWIPHNIPFDTLPEAFETVADAAREAGRSPSEIAVSPYVPTAVSDDIERARDAIRSHVAYYVGNGEGYRRAVGSAFPKKAEAIATEWRNGNRAAASEAVTDTMVDALGIASTPTDAATDLERVCEMAEIDTPIVVIPEKAPELVDPTIEAITR